MTSWEALTIRKEVLFAELSNLSKKVKGELSVLEAKVYLRRMAILESSFRNLHIEILTFNVGKEKKESVISTDDAFIEIIDFINKKCLSVSEGISASTSSASSKPSLPKIHIPTFDGSIENWESFISLFDSLVHNQRDIDNITKLQYLRLYTAKEANATVSTFTLQGTNYAAAYDALRNRYASHRRIASFHIQRLLRYNSKNDLLHFLELHRTSASALLNLNLDDLADFILFQIAYNNSDDKIKASFDNENTSDLPRLSDLLAHVEKRARSQELEMDVKTLATAICKQSSTSFSKPKQSRAHVTQTQAPPQPKCKFCNALHQTFHCQQFKDLSPQERVNFVKSSRACFNCLGSHEVKYCKSKSLCKTCGRPHHSLLHLPTSAPSTSSSPSVAMPPPSVFMAPPPAAEVMPAAVLSCISANQVLLATIHCQAQDSFGAYHSVYALLDNASQRSLVSTRLARRLGLQTKSESRSIFGLSSRESASQGVVQLKLRSRFTPPATCVLEASVLNHICDELPTADLSPDLFRQFSQLQLADDQFHHPKKIDILLGADVYANLLSTENPNLIPGQPTAQRTTFGWVLFGAAVNRQESPASLTMLIRSHPLESTLTRFWEVEQVASSSIHNPEDVIAEEHFVKTHSRAADGRYILRLPFRDGSNPDELSNRSSAEKCFMSLERRLNRLPQMKQLYVNFMNEFVEMNHMQTASFSSSYILPHHCVLKESTSTKLRCVFNASAKDASGKSLNELLLPGPKLQADIDHILIRFRFHNVALCGDIKMMFRQIGIHPDDTKFQHILWRSSSAEPLQEYEISRLVYGMTSSSFLAQRTLRQLAADEGHRFPNAATALVQDFYMDDYVGGAPSVIAAKLLRQELTELLDAGCLPLRKWSSSHLEVIDNLPDSHKEVPLEFSSGDPMLKILGLCYLPKEDAFSYRIQPFEGPATKRSVLSYISRCYDPLGLLCGVICRAKQFIQKLWSLHCDWDDPLPEPLLSDWREFLLVTSTFDELRIPRCFDTDQAVLRLVCFSDASSSAYAACVYLHVQRGVHANVHLVKAKSRVAPLKTQSIPRLELLGSLLASQLIHSVLDATPAIKYESIHMLTDSTIVLSWLKTPPHQLNTFIANRVVAITDLTSKFCWAHVSSENNAADCASRGFINNDIWWTGPHFLTKGPEFWEISIPTPLVEVPEKKPTVLVTQSPVKPNNDFVERYSSLTRLVRVTAYVLRFIRNTRCRSASTSSRWLSTSELNDALLRCVFITQTIEFSEEMKQLQSTKPLKISHRYAKLSPFVDKDGLLRVGGRLQHSSLSFTAKHPLLLPKKCHLSSLICDAFHKRLLHAGPRHTLSYIQRTFWIISAHSLVRQRIRMCHSCFRLNATPLQPPMADLPACRVQPAPPFYATASDFAGPFETKETSRRNSPKHKSYCCIFVDMASKAVHIEAVSELSTDAFMAAFHRFSARRSLPADLYTDCGRNYIGAARQLKEITSFLKSNQEVIHTKLAALEVKWHFNPPAAPNFGGIFEAAVKSMKLLLYRQIGNTVLTFEELSTLFCRIEAVLNSRPLGVLSSVPDGGDYLTPGHLLVGRPLVAPPEPQLLDLDASVGTRWKRVHALAQSFWRRWSKEYLHTQMQRQKWTRDCPNPTVGSLVYITGLASSPLSWPLGMIEKVYPSKDSKVRVASVRTSNGSYIRPINRLVFLPNSS